MKHEPVFTDEKTISYEEARIYLIDLLKTLVNSDQDVKNDDDIVDRAENYLENSLEEKEGKDLLSALTLAKKLSTFSSTKLDHHKKEHSSVLSFVLSFITNSKEENALRNKKIKHDLIHQYITLKSQIYCFPLSISDKSIKASRNTIIEADKTITLLTQQAKINLNTSIEEIALNAWEKSSNKKYLLEAFCIENPTKNIQKIYLILKVKAAEEKLLDIKDEGIIKIAAKIELTEAKIELNEHNGDKQETERLEKHLQDMRLDYNKEVDENDTGNSLEKYKARLYMAEHALKTARENQLSLGKKSWFSSSGTDKSNQIKTVKPITHFEIPVAMAKRDLMAAELINAYNNKNYSDKFGETGKTIEEVVKKSRGHIEKNMKPEDLELALAVVRYTEAELAYQKILPSNYLDDQKIKNLEENLIKDKINQLNIEIIKLYEDQEKTKSQKPVAKKVKLTQELIELFWPNYDNDKKNSQANKIKGLYFLGQFDYSLLRVLKDALVFSVAGGPALAVLKIAVVIANFAYQAIHANFLSIVESKNRYRFHITNMLFAGFFILFMLTISGMIPSIIPALPAVLWLGPSVNILLANPWIALNYVAVELLGVRKMDMDLQTVVNDTFDRPEIGRAQINMAVFGNLGALTSSLLLVYLLSSFTLISKVKIAIALVTISTILSSIVFMFWALSAEGKKHKSGFKDSSLLDIINSSSLSFEEIKTILKDKQKDLHEDMRVEEEIYISQKTNIFQKLWYLFKTPSLRAFFGIIAACTAAITVIEIIWKGEVSSYAKTHNADYGSIMGQVNSITSIGSILVGLLAGYAKSLSSRIKALAPPAIFAFFATFFTISIVCPTMLATFGFPPAMLSIAFGAAAVVSAKWSKYTLFEAANSEAWKRIFSKPFETAMKMWQQPIKGTTGKISKASAATLSAICISTGNPLILPAALGGIVTTWYCSASYLNPTEKVVPENSSAVTTDSKPVAKDKTTTMEGLSSLIPCLK